MKFLTMGLFLSLAACSEPATPGKPGQAEIDYAARRFVAQEIIAGAIVTNCHDYRLSPNADKITDHNIATLGLDAKRLEVNASQYQTYFVEYQKSVGYDMQSRGANYCDLGKAAIEASDNVSKMLVRN